MIPPIPGTEHRSAVSEDDRRTYWRYYFAGQALAGLMANSDWTKAHQDEMRWEPEVDAECAVAQADALLALLEGGAE